MYKNNSWATLLFVNCCCDAYIRCFIWDYNNPSFLSLTHQGATTTAGHDSVLWTATLNNIDRWRTHPPSDWQLTVAHACHTNILTVQITVRVNWGYGRWPRDTHAPLCLKLAPVSAWRAQPKSSTASAVLGRTREKKSIGQIAFAVASAGI